MVHPVVSEARLSLISGVWPMVSIVPSRTCMPGPKAPRARGDIFNLVDAQWGDKAGNCFRIAHLALQFQSYFDDCSRIGNVPETIKAH